MMLDYVNSGIRVMEGIGKRAGAKGLKSIQFLVGIGVVSEFVKYLGRLVFQRLLLVGFCILLVFGWLQWGLIK